MAFYTVAIIGRPNVGKSSLFNRLVGRKISIVEPTSGVTRDRILHTLRWENKEFDLLDTGGVGIVDDVQVAESVEFQIEAAIRQANLVIFLTDVMQGVTPIERQITKRLRKMNLPYILAANKCDNLKLEDEASVFCELGLGEPLPISVNHKENIRELMDRIAAFVPDAPTDEMSAPGLKLAIVGRRNAGKSSLVNYFAGEQRVIVSDLAGTTRDSVDVAFEQGGHRYVAIDTAGFRRKTQIKDAIEFFSMCRAERSIRRCDVVIFLIDATTEISVVDKRLASYVLEEARPIILVVNKWDLVKGKTLEQYQKYLMENLPGLTFAPMVAISAKTGFNIPELLPIAEDLNAQSEQRINTGKLNRVVQAAKRIKLPRPEKPSVRPKIYYATQVDVKPPTIVVFVNDPDLFGDEYKRYLSKYFRDHLNLPEIPFKILFRGRKQKTEPEESVRKISRGKTPPKPEADSELDDEYLSEDFDNFEE